MINDKTRRKELQAQYKQTPPEAGVYRIVNTQTNRVLLGSTPNLAGIRNRLAFAKSANMPGVLDQRLHADIFQFGVEAFSLEVLDVMHPTSEMTAAEIQVELATLEALWREQLDPALSY